MNKEPKAFDKMFDLLVEEAAEEADRKLGEQLKELPEHHIFSPEHKEKMEKVYRRERRSSRIGKLNRYVKRAACFLLAVLILSGITVGSVTAWRTRFLNFVLEIGKPNTHFNFGKKENLIYTDERLTMFYIPDGYQLVEKYSNEDLLCLVYDSGEQYFQFDLQPVDVNSAIDTENGIAEEIVINGIHAIYLSNPNINAVLWYDDEYSYCLLGTITKDELIKIVKNIDIH